MNGRNIFIAVVVIVAIFAYGYALAVWTSPDVGVVASVFSSLVTSGALTATLLWLTKTWIGERVKNDIKHQYDQKLETHKAELKAEQDVAIEQLKADLRIAAFEHETRFVQLHAKRAEVVAETYARLQDLVHFVADYVKIIETSADPPHEERRIKVNAALKEFNEYYRPNRIYLPGDTETRIDDLVKGMFHVAQSFARGVEHGEDEKTGKDSWWDADEWMESKAKPLFAELKKEFRKLLGDQE
jgi:hypothetical protein